MKRPILIPLVCLVGGVMASAWADDAALVQCRTLSDNVQRLQCYDRIVVPARPAAAGAPVTAPVAVPTATPQANAAAPASAQALAQAQRQQNIDNFGLPAQATAQSVQDIESRIPGAFLGWRGGSRITLANGQVWQVVDDSVGVMNGNDVKVKVRRGAMGAFYLELEGTNRSPRVKRLQ